MPYFKVHVLFAGQREFEVIAEDQFEAEAQVKRRFTQEEASAHLAATERAVITDTRVIEVPQTKLRLT